MGANGFELASAAGCRIGELADPAGVRVKPHVVEARTVFVRRRIKFVGETTFCTWTEGAGSTSNRLV